MAGKILVSTAYLPPVAYFGLISIADEALIEREENYIKQTFRNRCYILSANGPQILSIPVLLGSLHKTAIKDIRIDYSKRWQPVHLRAMKAAYNSSPWFEFYFDRIDQIISGGPEFLIDLNMELSSHINKMLQINTEVSFTSHFKAVTSEPNDYRYTFSPKRPYLREYKAYPQVFPYGNGFVPGLSIIDLIFNMGPEAKLYL